MRNKKERHFDALRRASRSVILVTCYWRATFFHADGCIVAGYRWVSLLRRVFSVAAASSTAIGTRILRGRRLVDVLVV